MMQGEPPDLPLDLKTFSTGETMLNRRTLLSSAALASVPLALPTPALAQGKKDAMVLAMALEPPGRWLP